MSTIVVICVIVAFSAFTVGAGYKWGQIDAEEKAYIEGMEAAAQIFRSSLNGMNATIKQLEEENDLLHERLGDEVKA